MIISKILKKTQKIQIAIFEDYFCKRKAIEHFDVCNDTF